MNAVTKNLLKNGLNGLARQEDQYFKQNIIDALAFKLNESIEELYIQCSNVLLQSTKQTQNTTELQEFLNFVNNFNPGKYEFKNKSLLNITESDLGAIKNLFEALNSENRQKMVSEIFNNGDSFKQHVEFYNKIQGLLK